METAVMRVLVAIDGSEPAGCAVDLVARVAWPNGSEIVVAEAVETGTAVFGGPWPAIAGTEADRIEADIRAYAQQTVRDACEKLTRPGLNVEELILHGRPATAIVEHARRMEADLVVVGSRGHGTIESMLLGSVSAEVVDHAPAPVLVARGSRVEKVVLAWDGSAGARGAANLLSEWPIFYGSTVQVVTVTDVRIPWWIGIPGTDSPEMLPMYLEGRDASRKEHEQLAREMAEQLVTSGVRAEPHPLDGDAATEILAAAEAGRADIIVMGTRGRTGISRLLLGSVARNVLQHASCSVLVVRDGKRPSRS